MDISGLLIWVLAIGVVSIATKIIADGEKKIRSTENEPAEPDREQNPPVEECEPAESGHKSPKKALAVLAAVIALVFLSRPLWCQHDFEKIGEDEAACETSGVEYRKCRKCGLKREEEINPLGHDMKRDNIDYEVILDTVYGEETYVCSRCGYSETSGEKCYGDFKEYCAKVGLGIWLAQDKLLVLDIDHTIVTPREDYYHVFGVCRSLLGSHAEQMLLADVEIGDEENGKAIPVGFGGKDVYVHVFKITTSAETESEDRIYLPAQKEG